MLQETALLTTAAWVGCVHTAIGVDHTLPFVMLSRTQRWSLGRTLTITAAAGTVHVLSSVLVGALGISLGITVDRLSLFEATRGEIAAWALILFGLAYAAWSHRRARKGPRHTHLHVHADGTVHRHSHSHTSHVHTPPAAAAPTSASSEGAHHRTLHQHSHEPSLASPRSTSIWLLLIFVLGPCEVLIPLLMFPAYALDPWLMTAVVGVFGATTVLTMLTIVVVGHLGIARLGVRQRFQTLEPHFNTIAGLAIAATGASLKLFGI